MEIQQLFTMKYRFVLILLLFFLAPPGISQGKQVENLGNGFIDYGIAVPVASSRGTVATMNNKNENIVLTWLMDGRGTYSLLMINTDTGESKQFSLPFSGYSYTSLLSENGCYYTHFKNHFVGFDPDKPGFTIIKKTASGTGRSMTQDENGVIWMVLSPKARLLSYDPNATRLTDYGIIYKNKARQLVQNIAADDGLIYIEVGAPGDEKVAVFNPILKETTIKGKLSVKKIAKGNQKAYFTTGNQALFKRYFSGGEKIKNWVSAVNPGFLASRKIQVESQKNKLKTTPFDYKTQGARLMGLAIGPRDNIVGGSFFPFHFFNFNPRTQDKEVHKAYGQFNTIAVQDNLVYFGVYPQGAILQWNSTNSWIPTNRNKKSNPNIVAETYPKINRPHDLLVMEGGNIVVMAGRPVARYTGSGLLFWDKNTQKSSYISDNRIVKNQSTNSLVQISEGLILGGTTIKPGDTGGMPKAKNAQLYIMDINNNKIVWAGSPIPGIKSYSDLSVTSNGLVLGVADGNLFFVFNPKTHEVIKKINLSNVFGSEIPFQQGQRTFIKGKKRDYLLLKNQILEFNPQSLSLSTMAKSPIPISGGGAYLNEKLFFIGNKSHIVSYDLSQK